jgi:glycosyltransferase involved in cell wall biosynthesis
VTTIPAVSVVMGVCNGAQHLAATVQSVLAQENVTLELVVVDDASTDNTPLILENFARADPRVKVMRHTENRGLTLALVAGCSAASAPLIARQDCGDLSHPRRLEIQAAMLDASRQVLFVSCATAYVGPDLESLWVAPPRGPAIRPAAILDLSSADMLTDGPTHHGSVMFRRDAYERAGGYRAEFRFGQDFDLWFRLAELGLFQITPEVLYTARILPESISSTARSQQQQLANLSRAALVTRQRGEPEAPILAQAAAVQRVPGRPSRRNRAAGLYFIGEALRRGRDPRARHYLRRAIAEWPPYPYAWLRLLQSLMESRP